MSSNVLNCCVKQRIHFLTQQGLYRRLCWLDNTSDWHAHQMRAHLRNRSGTVQTLLRLRVSLFRVTVISVTSFISGFFVFSRPTFLIHLLFISHGVVLVLCSCFFARKWPCFHLACLFIHKYLRLCPPPSLWHTDAWLLRFFLPEVTRKSLHFYNYKRRDV